MPDEKLQENQEEEIEVEVEIEDEEEQLSSSAEDSTDSKDSDELENYSEGVKKRISKLTAKMREAERREAAATEYAKAVQAQLEESNKKSASLDKSFVQEFENRLTAQDQLLHNSLKEAIDRGDVDKQVEVQKQLATVANQTEKLTQAKKRQEEEAATVEQPVQQQVAQPQQAAPDPKATRWAAKNEWFGADEPMTLTAFSFHKNMIETEGYDPTSDDYYAELDRRMAEEFPHKLAKKSNGPARSAPAVGAANRNSSGRGKQQVKLTPSQLAIVKKLGIKKEDYARQMLRMQNS
jgi:chemotaxis protein histidine kinase CheA